MDEDEEEVNDSHGDVEDAKEEVDGGRGVVCTIEGRRPEMVQTTPRPPSTSSAASSTSPRE